MVFTGNINSFKNSATELKRRMSKSTETTHPALLYVDSGQKVHILGFLTEFSIFFFHRLLMGVFPFVFYHPLETVDPCFEDSHEGFFADFVETVVIALFKLLSSVNQGCRIL
jgi:hypothetical protein